MPENSHSLLIDSLSSDSDGVPDLQLVPPNSSRTTGGQRKRVRLKKLSKFASSMAAGANSSSGVDLLAGHNTHTPSNKQPYSCLPVLLVSLVTACAVLGGVTITLWSNVNALRVQVEELSSRNIIEEPSNKLKDNSADADEKHKQLIDSSEKTDSLQLSKIVSRLDALEQRVEEFDDDHSKIPNMQNEVAEAKNTVDGIKNKLTDVTNRLSSVDRSLAQLNAKVDDAVKKSNNEMQKLIERLDATAASSSSSPVTKPEEAKPAEVDKKTTPATTAIPMKEQSSAEAAADDTEAPELIDTRP